jgi:hypothetical protein
VRLESHSHIHTQSHNPSPYTHTDNTNHGRGYGYADDGAPCTPPPQDDPDRTRLALTDQWTNQVHLHSHRLSVCVHCARAHCLHSLVWSLVANNNPGAPRRSAHADAPSAGRGGHAGHRRLLRCHRGLDASV